MGIIRFDLQSKTDMVYIQSQICPLKLLSLLFLFSYLVSLGREIVFSISKYEVFLVTNIESKVGHDILEFSKYIFTDCCF